MPSWKLQSHKRARSRWILTLVVPGLLYLGGTAFSAESLPPIITTVAGGGTAAGNGDFGPATNARLSNPVDVALDATGSLYIADVPVQSGQDGFKVRKVNAAGIITTVAGNGSPTYNGDGIAATSAGISVKGIAVDGAGNLFIADAHNQRIRKVASNGIITTVAGTGTSGFSGDGGPAQSARLNFPSDVATDSAGNLFIVDGFNHRIRRVGLDGVIRTVAGNGQYGFSGDGGPAIAASLYSPHGVAVDRHGNIFIADYGNDRVRRVTPAGVISTIAGGGHFRNDPVATSMKLLHPHGVAVDGRGNLYVAETNNLVRVVNSAGIIEVAVGAFNDTTFGNEGAPWGFAGDGGPASQALIYEPLNLALDSLENLYIADSRNGRVRKVTTIPTPATPAGLDAFQPYEAHEVGSFTQHVAVADVTGDGRDDALLTTTTWSGPYAEPENDMKLWVFVQKADGTLAAPLKYGYFGDTVGGMSGTGLATGDLNRDGSMDVVVGTLKGITIYLGHSAGLRPGVSFAGVTGAEVTRGLVTMDVNRDGKLDIVTLSGGRSEGGSSPTDKVGKIVFYGDGAGGISSKQFHLRPDEYGWNLFGTGDVNGDGIPDLTSAWTETGTGVYRGGAEVALHDGVGGFMATARMHPAETGQGWGAAYALGDFNSDGRRDLIVARGGNAPAAAYSYFRQGADGRFSEVRQWRAYDSPADMISADMNGDGLDDLLVVHGGWSSIGYHEQTHAGLGVEIKYYTVQSGNPRHPSIAVGDLNGDKCKDVAMADYNHGLIVMHGRNCLIMMNGSQPLLPPKLTSPAAIVSAEQSISPANNAAKPGRQGLYSRTARRFSDFGSKARQLGRGLDLSALEIIGLIVVLTLLLRLGAFWRVTWLTRKTA